MNEKDLCLILLEYIKSQYKDCALYGEHDAYDYIFEQERRRSNSELNRINGLEKIVNNWEKHADDFKKQICAVDPAPARGNTKLWLRSNAYTALNRFLSQYSIDYRKRNKSFGARRIYVATRELDDDVASDLANIIYQHLMLKIDVGVVFEEDIKGLVNPRFYNCNVIANRMVTDAEYFEEDEEHPILIVDNKSIISDTYENFRILWRNAIKFNNNAIKVDLRSAHIINRGRVELHPILKFYIYLRDHGVCGNCGSSTGVQFDHVFPCSLGGSNHVDNFQLLCDKCNVEKSNKI